MDNIKTDILIVGAGATGIAASLSAVKTCKNVILAEQLSYVGGLITAGLVTMFCGMEGNDSEAIQDILKELKKYDGVLDTKDGPLVNPEIFKIAVEGMLTDRGVKILYNSHAYLVPRLYRMITEVIFKNNEKTIIVEPKVVIDCTGNGDIFYYCGEPYKEYYSKDIPIGLVVRIGGISEEAEKYLLSKEGKTRLKELDIPVFEKTAMKSIMWTIVNYSGDKFISDSLQDFSCSRGLSGITAIKDGYMVKKYEDINAILIHLRKKALEISVNLKKNNILKNSFLLDTAPLIGIRISRLLRGKSILNYITDSASVIDEYKDMYECLMPEHTKNLLVAGRCISAELSVMDRMRVIPACFATGEMAGVTAVKLINKEGGKYGGTLY